jgi:hypothetical protein
VRLGAETLDLIIGSDRGLDKLKIYKVGSSSPPLTDITDPSVGFIFNSNQVKICAQKNWILASISWRFIGSFALEMFSGRHDLLSAGCLHRTESNTAGSSAAQIVLPVLRLFLSRLTSFIFSSFLWPVVLEGLGMVELGVLALQALQLLAEPKTE